MNNLNIEWTDFVNVAVKIIFFYSLIIFTFRLMGKREIGELSLLDLVVFILIAELAAIAVDREWEIVILMSTAILILSLVQWITAYVSLKNNKIRRTLEGVESIIISDGVLNITQMRKNRYSTNDLLTQLHEKGIRSISEVQYAILETSGQLAVFKKNDEKNDIIPLPLIVSGSYSMNNLKTLNIQKDWVEAKLREKGYDAPEKLLYVNFEKGDLFVAETKTEDE